MNVNSWLRKELDFVPNWKRASFTGLGLGLVLSLLMILLQPFDTYQYQSPYKNLELLGYTPCIMLSMLLMVPLENWFFHKQGQRWQIWNEILIILLGGGVMMTASHIYNVFTISGGVPSLRSWWSFIKGFGLPFFIFLAPMWAVVRQKFKGPPATAIPTREDFLLIKGQNKGEQLQLSGRNFLYAKAQQNYMEVHYWDDRGVPQKQILRLTLAQLQQQIPGAQQIHRSYLINPVHVSDITGNTRKRFVLLNTEQVSLPVSPKYYEALKEQLSNSAQ